jgi:hypothetical protein
VPAGGKGDRRFATIDSILRRGDVVTEKRAGLPERFRNWRARRKHERYERKIRARENLKNYRPPSGTEGGAGGAM